MSKKPPNQTPNGTTQIIERLKNIEEKLEEPRGRLRGFLDVADKLVLPLALIILSVLTFVQTRNTTNFQNTLASQQNTREANQITFQNELALQQATREENLINRQEKQQSFERQLELQKLYIENITSPVSAKQNAAILTLGLMEEDNLLELANFANDLNLTQEQRQQIIKILCRTSSFGCPWTVLEGVVARVYDGDTISFIADNDANWLNIDSPLRFQSDNANSIRFTGVDAPEVTLNCETDFSSHKALGHEAKEELEVFLAFSEDSTIESKAFFLTSVGDLFGRSIGLLYPSEAGLQDGSVVFLTEDLVQKSINFRLLQQGVAYPLFDDDLPDHALEVLQSAATSALDSRIGVWAKDVSVEGFEFSLNNSEWNNLVIWPRLLRRICQSENKFGSETSVYNLFEFLTLNYKDYESGTGGRLDTFLDIQEDHIRMTTHPINLITLR